MEVFCQLKAETTGEAVVKESAWVAGEYSVVLALLSGTDFRIFGKRFMIFVSQIIKKRAATQLQT